MLVIHENRGLTDHIRNVAGRFAASGFSALALDLLSEEGGPAAFPGEAEVAAALSAAPPERFDATAPFSGPFPEGGDLRNARAAVLAVYGGLDTRVLGTRDAAVAALQAARLEHKILTFTEADHAFFNDTGPRFNPPAAEEAWRRVIGWFGRRDD